MCYKQKRAEQPAKKKGMNLKALQYLSKPVPKNASQTVTFRVAPKQFAFAPSGGFVIFL